MTRYDPTTFEDLTEMLGPVGLKAMMLGVVACAALAVPARAETPKATQPTTAAASAATARGAAPALPENRAEIAAYDLDTLAAPVVRVRRPSPMDQEVRKVLEDERKTLTDLRARFAAASNPEAALQVQREIEQVKVGTEVALLRVQATFARREGRLEHARRIEAEIEEVLNPRTPAAATPTRRIAPAPSATTPR